MDPIKLVNAPFDITFKGATYSVKQANLTKAFLFRDRQKQIIESKDPASELKIASYALFLVLRDVIPNLTEQDVSDNVPADIDVLNLLTVLGFMSQQQANLASQIKEVVTNKNRTTGESSQSSQSGQDGLLDKSQI
jgi:hypothetical protein